MPRALMQTSIFIGILYFLIVLVYLSVLPEASGNGATLIDLGRELMGPIGVIVITLAAFFSIGGNLSSIMLAVPRLTFALAEQQLLPKWFGHIHGRYSTPSNSILVFGALGNNEQMVKVQGVNPATLKLIGVGLSNGLVALSGAFAAQYQGFADVNLGQGIVVSGLASVMAPMLPC